LLPLLPPDFSAETDGPAGLSAAAAFL
jgi:hypothetical protein